ncbi:MAG: hypothetical protein JO046_26915 [Solirubrobacterales bacterium]|nr:hypothetical protein [Solirubrobacterales bacterium]MBV9685453.1 hypothetical protein [Solirubrobacterales bacterium]
MTSVAGEQATVAAAALATRDPGEANAIALMATVSAVMAQTQQSTRNRAWNHLISSLPFVGLAPRRSARIHRAAALAVSPRSAMLLD